MKIWVVLALILVIVAAAWSFEKKKNKEQEVTQTLQIPKEPPNAVVAETRRLVFHTSLLSAKGLLSQQARDALRALLKAAAGSSIFRIRAFVAGSGDLRRVQAIVSETFTDRHLNLPALSVVQVGGLPLEGAQVVLESIAASKKELNPAGLALISGQAASSGKPLDPVGPLAEKSLARLRLAVLAAGSNAGDVLRVTCFLSSLEGAAAVRGMFERQYRHAALNFVQTERAPLRSICECEAVARLHAAPAEPLNLVNPEGLDKSPNYSQIALIGAARVALTGTQVAFGFQDSDARLAFKRLAKVLEGVGASVRDVGMSSIYPLSSSIAEQVRRIRFEFYDKTRPPASTMLTFEGLPSMDASFGLDVIAVLPN